MASEASAESFRARSIANPVAVILVCAIGLTFLGLTILFSASVSLKQDPYFYLDKQVLGVAAAGLLCFLAEQDQPRLRAPGVGVDRRPGRSSCSSSSSFPTSGCRSRAAAAGWATGPRACRCPSSRSWRWCSAWPTTLPSTRRGSGTSRGATSTRSASSGRSPGSSCSSPISGRPPSRSRSGSSSCSSRGPSGATSSRRSACRRRRLPLLVAHNPNRLRRFTAFLDVEGNRQGGTYQLYQSLEAFAAGGIGGAGLGQGRQQINFLPEAHTDFIFAVVGRGAGDVVHAGRRRRCSRSSSWPGSPTCAGRPTSSISFSPPDACSSCACSPSSTWAS